MAIAGVAALVGCAEGSDTDVYGESALGTDPDDAGEETSKTVLPAPSQGTDAGKDSGSADAGTKVDSGADAGADSGTGPVTGTCTTSNTCATGTSLGSVSGDTKSDVVTAQGSTSQWFNVRVTEDDTGIFGTSERAKVSLTSPPGSNFDLYVYLPSSDTLECSAVTKSSTSTAAVDSVSIEWGEGSGLANGSDDSRTVTVEVRYVSGTCAAGTKWTLSVQGNTN
ncbi:hypothetical protein AKJ09_05322 [Labilithrix luteola]|uniref:Uncharacterized protein n=1 Tax=Labilithrix luteola TaxID=1391654 RepID=A0A0K1PYQ1_9BACT|nr:hypothetical protein AKJ09_05322 [Labilithrix luteola]